MAPSQRGVAAVLAVAIAAAYATLINDVTVAVAGTFSDAVATAYAAFIKDIAVAVAGAFSDAVTPTIVHGTGPVANATGIVHTHALIDVVADTIHVGIHPRTSTFPAFIQDIAVAIAGTIGDAFAAAYATLVENIAVTVTGTFGDPVAAAYATLVKDVAVAIALPLGNVVARSVVKRRFDVVVASHLVRASRDVAVVEFQNIAPFL